MPDGVRVDCVLVGVVTAVILAVVHPVFGYLVAVVADEGAGAIISIRGQAELTHQALCLVDNSFPQLLDSVLECLGHREPHHHGHGPWNGRGQPTLSLDLGAVDLKGLCAHDWWAVKRPHRTCGQRHLFEEVAVVRDAVRQSHVEHVDVDVELVGRDACCGQLHRVAGHAGVRAVDEPGVIVVDPDCSVVLFVFVAGSILSGDFQSICVLAVRRRGEHEVVVDGSGDLP